MKATVINDTTFRLCFITIGGYGLLQCRTMAAIDGQCAYSDLLSKRDWLNENTPGWEMPEIIEDIDDSTAHYELHVKFKTPADAVAFKLRWM